MPSFDSNHYPVSLQRAKSGVTRKRMHMRGPVLCNLICSCVRAPKVKTCHPSRLVFSLSIATTRAVFFFFYSVSTVPVEYLNGRYQAHCDPNGRVKTQGNIGRGPGPAWTIICKAGPGRLPGRSRPTTRPVAYARWNTILHHIITVAQYYFKFTYLFILFIQFRNLWSVLYIFMYKESMKM